MNTTTHLDDPASRRMNDGGRRRSLWKAPASVAAFSVLLTLLGNHFVDGWNWPPRAFVVLGALVFAIGFSYELITRNRGAIAYRAAVAIAFAAGFSLTWGSFVQMA